jgi:hypothetical protein
MVRFVLWSAVIGLAKLQGDREQVRARFLSALNSLRDYKDADLDKKLMAAEIITASGMDFLTLEEPLSTLEKRLRDQYNISPKVAVGIAATLIYARNSNDAYPIDRFEEFLKLTNQESGAAMLAVSPKPVAELTQRFNSFKAVFEQWGSHRTEDTELATTFLAMSDMDIEEAKPKVKALVELIRNDLEYPLVPAAILASMPISSPAEIMALVEKAVEYLKRNAADLSRSQLLSLAVRMVHGTSADMVHKIDSTATVERTPVQFTHRPMQSAYGAPGFYSSYGMGPRPFPYLYYWLIVSHNSHSAHYANIGGYHPSHSHGVGGFYG